MSTTEDKPIPTNAPVDADGAPLSKNKLKQIAKAERAAKQKAEKKAAKVSRCDVNFGVIFLLGGLRCGLCYDVFLTFFLNAFYYCLHKFLRQIFLCRPSVRLVS